MEEGQTFPEFALECARAFGALIMMRDAAPGAPIPKFSPSDHNRKALSKAKRELARLLKLTPKGQLEHGTRARNASIKSARDWLKRDQEGNARLHEVEAKVQAWEAPTPDHAGLKKFMLEQINISKGDCAYIERHIHEVESKSPMGYFAAAVASARRDIEYHTKAQAEEIDRTEGRNKWVKILRDSLPT